MAEYAIVASGANARGSKKSAGRCQGRFFDLSHA
jgi:hypothetical protein